MPSFLQRFAGALFIALLSYSTAAADLTVLARTGPWPVADNLVAYRGKIWFSVAVKGVNHNSADIWSFDPATRKSRFERYLFSQDAGRPVVHKGLLYWPHEDMRIGIGLGVLSVTNGRDWRNLYLSVGDYMMHTHVATEWRGRLIASLAGWNSAIVSSDDGGANWRTLINAPPSTGSFHRYNGIVALGDRIFVRHWQTTGVSLVEYRDGEMIAVKGWPKTHGFLELSHFRDALYGLLVNSDGQTELWRLASGPPEQVEIGTGNLDMKLMVNDGKSLSVIVGTEEGGRLWTSVNGVRFSKGDAFYGGRPYSAVAPAPGQIYIGGAGSDGRAILWGPNSAITRLNATGYPALPSQSTDTERKLDIAAARNKLERALRNPESYEKRGRLLQIIIDEIAALKPPSNFFSSFLDDQVPDIEIATFGGRFSVSTHEIATWRLMGAMARNADRTVPVEYLKRPWSREANGPEKWLDPLLIALHAIQVSRQNDRETIDALVKRLDEADDPDWLHSQVTGTLGAITGQRFAYNKQAWKSWWASQTPD